jgi:spore germination cell wall hydrolase CwlJ-like protein
MVYNVIIQTKETTMGILYSIGLASSAMIVGSMIGLGVQAKQMSYQDPIQDIYTVDAEERKCLALNIYFEARGESRLGQIAVAWVTMNRVHSPDYPDTVCNVVWEDKQFSWTHDGKSDKPKDGVAWVQALFIAEGIIKHYNDYVDPTDGSTMFHSIKVNPKWNDDYTRTARIDDHIFYK